MMKVKYLLVAGAALLVFVLAGCTLEYDTKIQPDQSGTVSLAIGLTADEVKYMTSQSSSDTSGICAEMWKNSSTKLPANTVTRQEQKGDETWCYTDVKVANLAELRSYYGDQNVTVNRLEVVNNTFFYDVSTDMTSDKTSTGSFPLTVTWKVSMPGPVKSNNADSASGNTLTWDLTSATGVVDMKAESSLSSSSSVWWVVGGLIFLCLVLLVIAAGVGVFFYVRRKKKTPAPETPA
jgi:hypothetical protein